MKKVYILAVASLLGQPAWGQIRDFQTTRLNSTAGTGVASILSTEAAILNPASAGFFDGSSFSYQSYSTDLRKESSDRTAGEDFPSNNDSTGAFMADHSGPVKGGVAYLQQNENNFKRERMVFHAAAPIGPTSSMGLSYNYIKDKLPSTYSPRHQIEHQVNLGLTHIIDEDTIVGLVVQDLTRTSSGEERALVGFQYDIADRIMILGDVGVQYTKSVSEKYIWRAAAQLTLFSDFFFRAGKFYDNITEFKGTGWGAGWVGPRFGVEFAQKFSDKIGSDGYVFRDEQLVDTSLSVIIKF